MAVAPGPDDNSDPNIANDNADSSIVSSVDGEGPDREYVIADITEDDAWLSVEEGEARDLDSWR